LKNVSIAVCVCVLTLGLLAGPLLSQTPSLTVPIVISPSTINLDSEGVWVTVHADIPYASVVGVSVTLNDVAVEVTKADNRGELVAKFAVDDVKAIVEPGTVELTLCGDTVTREQFTGTDAIEVIKVSGNR